MLNLKNTKMKKIQLKSIGAIGNYYGGLYITKYNDKFYWIIENYDTNFNDITEWDEIPESLYNELLTQQWK